MSGISDGSIVVITPPPDTKGGPPGVLDAGSNKANAASNITPPNPLPVPEEVSPSQDVWEQAEEDQPIDPNNPPKPKADGTPRKPKLNYFWKVNIEAKDAGKVAWNPMVYALFYTPPPNTKRSDSPPAQSKRSPSPKRNFDDPPSGSGKRKAGDASGSSTGDSSPKARKIDSATPPPQTMPPPQTRDQYLEAESKVPPEPQNCIFIEWDRFARYRQVPFAGKIEEWSGKDTERTFLGVGADGQVLSSRPLTASEGVDRNDINLIKFFNDRFELSQAKATALANLTRFPYWAKTPNVNWKRSNTAAEETDGISFHPRANGGGPIMPDTKSGALYVKLNSTLEAKILFTGDVYAADRGISKDGIYVLRSVIEQLKAGLYPWPDYCNTIPIRQSTGRINYITVDASLQKSAWWQLAWTHGVAKQEGKAVRSRNVGGLKVLFVAVDESAGVTKSVLENMAKKAVQDAMIPIKQEVVVCTKAEFDVQKKTYGRYLGTSPFGDYETWIREQDFVSYLSYYKGYQVPAQDPKTLDDIKNAFAALKPKATAISKNKELTEKIAKQDKDWKEKLKSNYRPDIVGATISVVSSESVAKAGVRGARQTVPDQGKQMGGSATDVAKAAGWPGAADRLGKEMDVTNGLDWDAPGVYPAEWLHRIAFSWGAPGGIDLASVNTNFVFGSSEANSLMTRFEKSWQGLFKKERSYQNEIMKRSADPTKFKYPEFRGLLMTLNTAPDMGLKITDYSVDSNKAVKAVIWDKAGGKVTKDGADATVDFWSYITNPTDPTKSLGNLSYSLDYELKIVDDCHIRALGYLNTMFYPFQRGFFTRIEAEVDYMLLDWWTTEKIKLLAVASAPGGAGGQNLPGAAQPDALIAGTKGIDLNATGAAVLGNAMQVGSPIIVSTSTPGDLPQADVWRTAISGQAVQVGGVQLNNTSVLTTDNNGLLTKVPLDTSAMSNAASSGQIQAVVSEKPLTTSTPPVQGTQAATVTKTIDAPAELQISDGPNGIPARFVLSGNIRLFGKIDEQLYSYYGEPSVGLRQIVPVKPGTAKLSDYIPHLAGSEFDSVQLENTQFVYNQYTTATDQSGTWLQTDILFSGVLQPVSDVLKNVFHQEKPLLRVQTLLSTMNDWSTPPMPSSFGLRGSFPSMSVQFADLIEFTDLGLSVNIGRRRQPWPPYDYKIDWGVGFFGSLNLETPNDIAPLTVNYMLSEYAGVMTLIMSMEDRSPNFFGCTGLHLSDVQFTANFGVGDNPTGLGMVVSATLELRETDIQVGGNYTKGDWSIYCDLEDFDFASLRDLYEDLFGSPLHLTDHEIVVNDLTLVAGSTGIMVSGAVTIEGYSCAEASISVSQLGVRIDGAVDDIHLAKDVVLKEATLDIFIGPISDTMVDGPGTSFSFNINGTVAFGSTEVSASLFIAKDPTIGLVWTVFGSVQGAFSLSKIAPDVKGSFLDLALQEACIIASNVDGSTAARLAIPSKFPVIKGVQFAASVGAIGTLDHAMNNKSGPTSGMTLQAMYNESTSAFDLAINLAIPQTVSMKASTIWSGPISLLIEISANPSLSILADFFVRVPNQDAPLKFTGGIKANIEEAKAFIELKNQWWNDPFGLSSQLKLGPDLALQIGIVYAAAPLYPSELGVAAGLMIGDVTGQAALSVSEAPNDELIMVKVDNLGVRDLVSFASTIFEHDFPKPNDFLQFKEVELYLSTGTTIGTTYYPPGASFSCDAILFGKEASIYCGVSKLTKSITVKGSLEPIDIGPVSISGYQPGTKAQIDVELGAIAQTVFISGNVRIGNFDTAISLNASFQPTITFDLHCKLDFSTHLKFQLDADMRNGSFTSMSGLQSLDFDIHVFFQQDILDYITAQVNTQILSAKKGVDDGIDSAQSALDGAQNDFQAQLKVASDRLKDAKAKYDLKVAQVTGAFQAEKTRSDLQLQKLQGDVNRTFQAFQGAIAKATDDLRIAGENRANAIKAAEQNVTNAQNNADSKINGALHNLKNAQDDMQRRFGNALHNLQNAENDVNSKQRVVQDAQRDVNNAKHDLDHCHWCEKVAKGAVVGAMGTKLETAKTGLKIATGLLQAAQAIVSGPGYSAANVSIKFYQDDLNAARSTADATLAGAKAGMQETTNVQNDFVNKATTVLNTVQNAGKELQDSNLAKKAFQDFQKAENIVLNGLSTAITGLMNCGEKVAFDTATSSLNIANANTKDIDIAKSALKFADEGTDAVLDVGGWVVKHTLNILNIKSVEVTGDLRGLCKQGTELKAHIEGTFADNNIDFSVDFVPVQGEEMVKRVFAKLMGDVKAGVMSIKKDL